MPKRTLYHPSLCEKLVELMAKGLFDYQVAARFKISEDAFIDWRKKWPDFGESYLEGRAARKDYYASKAHEFMTKAERSDPGKGYKYFAALAGEELGFQKQNVINTGPQVNIGNLNLLESKSREDLIEFVQDKLKNLPIEGQFEEIKLIESTNESDQPE